MQLEYRCIKSLPKSHLTTPTSRHVQIHAQASQSKNLHPALTEPRHSASQHIHRTQSHVPFAPPSFALSWLSRKGFFHSVHLCAMILSSRQCNQINLSQSLFRNPTTSLPRAGHSNASPSPARLEPPAQPVTSANMRLDLAVQAEPSRPPIRPTIAQQPSSLGIKIACVPYSLPALVPSTAHVCASYPASLPSHMIRFRSAATSSKIQRRAMSERRSRSPLGGHQATFWVALVVLSKKMRSSTERSRGGEAGSSQR
ncbi:hypothetical protein BDV96DRAFT_20302 [Lophiotrema nucula]|uniref:Uncharacterized protein n=1 Tax=Lophiotrema nucula TaxID=690887 RepID=A0A6A5ZDR2_9PLEO|nr:hypothetical protein BDV96DRAFT_20302 [Lophiotrema nucula]